MCRSVFHKCCLQFCCLQKHPVTNYHVYEMVSNDDDAIAVSFPLPSKIDAIVLNIAMHLFESVSQFYGLMGLNPPQSNQNRLFNLRISCFFIISVATVISILCYFLLNPLTALERAESIYLILSALGCIMNYFVSYRKIREIYLFIENVNKYIERSKWWNFENL